jgi:hypothetical protein
MNITEIFIKRPVMTSLVMMGIVLFGIAGYGSLPVSDLPNVDFPTIQVNASLPGASPETMATAVATPLERCADQSQPMRRGVAILLGLRIRQTGACDFFRFLGGRQVIESRLIRFELGAVLRVTRRLDILSRGRDHTEDREDRESHSHSS